MLDQLVTLGDGLPAFDRLTVARDRARRQIALAVRERLVELHGEAMGEVVEDIFSRRDVHPNVVPLLGRDLGQSPFHQRLAGGDDLHDGGMARVEVGLDRPDQGRRLHAGQEMAEEALLGALEGRARGGLGLPVQRAIRTRDVRRLHRRVEVIMDDAERPGIGVVDTALFLGQRVLDQLIFHAVIGERAGGVEAERSEVARQHFHRRDAAVLDRFDELGPRGEWEILAAPEAEPLGIGEIMDRGGAGR